MNTKQLKWLSYLSCLVMFLATLGGSVVTKTESGLGCGNDWPLCHGKFVPAHTIASMIEYSHRAISGGAGLLSLGAFVAFWLYRKHRRDLQIYSFLALFFVMVQAFMGAMAVIYPTSSAVMALHFGFSLIAFASSVMLVLGIREDEAREASAPVAPKYYVSKGFRNLTWFATAYTYIVVYIGAYVSHTDSAGGCSGWPLCNKELIPELSGGVGIAFAHRVAALLLLIVVATVGHFAYRKHPGNREIRALGIAATVLILTQVFTGASIVFTLNNYEVYLFTSLAHIIVLAALFGVLCYMSVRTWQMNKNDNGNAGIDGRLVAGKDPAQNRKVQ
ncbi:COX15/CtaA family protein [Fontibacillus phaseoli]|uniref:COX15/CtaA family protein n=1 Tax=Fontibacillus phaseoli TaxID=1416533 RepID=UPI000DF2F6D4|nr:heme A synthase [Fontibacillus phaseoli]